MAGGYGVSLSGSATTFTSAAVAAIVTALAIRYTHRRRMYDLPGQRRLHDVATPRGGGIAIVVAMIVGGVALAIREGQSDCLPLLLPPLLGVAWVGWLDDHGGLSALKRLAMHVVAAAWVCAGPLLLSWAIPVPDTHLDVFAMIAAWVAMFAVVWSINLHNFMDGINGLLAWQAIFVFAALAVLFAWREGDGAILCMACAAACIGFLPFNFPRARVFMGDVGSGALGFAIAMAVVWQVAHDTIAAASGLVLCSAFATDATCTLLSRMLGGRRWYSAHREHLYQWLVRSGFSHARVVAFYMGWNVLVALPVALYMNRTPQIPMPAGLTPAVAVYTLAVTAWWIGKRWCVRRVRQRSAHAAA